MKPANLRLRFLWLGLSCCLIGLIVFLSLTSSPPTLVKFQFGDKVGHFLAYLTLMAWFGQLYVKPRHLMLLALAFISMGVGLEFLQGMTGHRFFEFADMAANTIGVLVGWWLSENLIAGMLAKLENRLIFSTR